MTATARRRQTGSTLDRIRALTAPGAPEAFFRKAALAGDPFPVTLPGLGKVVFTRSADGAKELFSAPPETFAPVLPNPIEPLLGPGSLILLNGSRHARERKLVAAPLCGRRMHALGDAIADAASQALVDQDQTGSLSARSLTRALTLEVIVRAVFGVRDPERQAVFRAATLRMLDAYTPQLMFVPQLRRRWIGRGWRRFARARAAFDALLADEISRKRAGSPGDDILSLLLGLRYDDGAAMSNDAILDELRTLLVAGHETTATGLAWALHYVHADERIRERLASELAAIPSDSSHQQLARLPYLSAVCREALRIHPVVPILLRHLRKPMVLRGVALDEGTKVGVAVTELHRDPDYFPQPDRFDPERFLGSPPPPHAYVPFGGGHRRCIGAGFAAYEMKIALSVIMRSGPLHPEPSKPPRPVLHNITMGPNVDFRFTRTRVAR